jgi:hypothetical protein
VHEAPAVRKPAAEIDQPSRPPVFNKERTTMLAMESG